MVQLSMGEAGKLALRAQLLNAGPSFTGKEGALAVIDELGYVQVDTISVIERAHHHTLWTRVKGYEPEMLNELLIERKVFEYWGHAASYLPMKDYRFYLPKKREFDYPHGKWEKDRMVKFGHLMETALKRIEAEGPLGSKDFELPEGRKKIIAEALRDLLEEGTIEKVSIEKLEGKVYYASADDLETTGGIEIKRTVHILSPFDNLVIQRERLKNLFGFDYVLECYVPPKKRVHGYFVLPILWSGKVVARMDAKAERKQKTLIIRNLIFEPGFKMIGGFKKAFERKIAAFAKFNKCESIVFEQVTPAYQAVFDSKIPR